MKRIILLLIVVGIIAYMCSSKPVTIVNQKNTGKTIVAFGDSLTYGKGASRMQAYPAVLARSVSRPVINMGKNGETAVQAPNRIYEVFLEKPYMVLIEFGGNDLLQGVPFEKTVAAMEDMIDRVQRSGAIAVIVDTGGSPLMKRYSKAYKKIAAEKGAIFVPGILDGIFNKKELMSDKIHPNAQGYSLVADKVLKAIQGYL